MHGACRRPLQRYDANHLSLPLGPLRLKWERHGEFSGYTFIVDGQGSKGFDDTAMAQLPPGWLAAVPGRTIMAAHALLLAGDVEAATPERLATWFGTAPVAVFIDEDVRVCVTGVAW